MRGVFAPRPGDFAEVAKGRKRDDLAAHYGVSGTVISRWRREIGLRYANFPLPADFVQVAERSRTAELVARYGVGEDVIKRWRAECGIVWPRAVPADFAKVAPTMTRRQLQKHYRATGKTIRRWIAESGVQSSRQNHQREAARARWGEERPARRRQRVKPAPGGGLRLMSLQSGIPPRDSTREGEAADFLRRWAVIYRSTAAGAYDPKGGFWRYGATVLTGEQLVARARRHGWNPDEWRDAPAPKREGFAQQQEAR